MDYREDYFHSHRYKGKHYFYSLEHVIQQQEVDRENNQITDVGEKILLDMIKQDVEYITTNFMEALYIEQQLVDWIEISKAIKKSQKNSQGKIWSYQK